MLLKCCILLLFCHCLCHRAFTSTSTTQDKPYTKNDILHEFHRATANSSEWLIPSIYRLSAISDKRCCEFVHGARVHWICMLHLLHRLNHDWQDPQDSFILIILLSNGIYWKMTRCCWKRGRDKKKKIQNKHRLAMHSTLDATFDTFSITFYWTDPTSEMIERGRQSFFIYLTTAVFFCLPRYTL